MDQQTESLSTELDNQVTDVQPSSTQPEIPSPTLGERIEANAQKVREKGTVAPPLTPEAAAATAAQAFSPNFKFKAANKDHEIPEFLRGVIKDEQSQKYMHQLFEKAYGIDAVKERFQGLRQEHQQLNQAYGTVMQTVQMGREAYQRGDLDTVFKTFSIPEEKVLQWAVKKVQLSQLPHDQRSVHEAREAAERRNWELERSQASTSQEHLQTQSQHLVEMLDIVLERPDISAVAQAYEARKSPGAFRDLAIQMGVMEYNTSGKVLSPLEAAQKASDLLGGVPQNSQPQQAAAQAAPAQQATPATSVQPQKIMLPNAGGGRAAAPAKSKIKSLDDIRRVHAQMAQK